MSNFLRGCNKWFDEWQMKQPTQSKLNSKLGSFGGSNESVSSIASTNTSSSSSSSGGGVKRKSDAGDENDTQTKQNRMQSSL